MQEEPIYNDGHSYYKIRYNNGTAYVSADYIDECYEHIVLWLALRSSNFSTYGVNMLKSLEGLSEIAKIFGDETLFTIGYGHVIEDGSSTVTINGITYSELDEELATTLLMEDLNTKFIPAFNVFLSENNIHLNQNQYDACIMDCYQKGMNIWQNQVRDIAKFILENEDFDNFDKVLDAFLDGTTSNGGINRRTKEANLFVYGAYV